MVLFLLGVHFTVGLSQDTTFMEDETIKFNKIINSVGGGYIDDSNNADYGKFIAPQSGTYQFNANFYHENKNMGGDLMKRGQLVIVTNNGGDGSCSLSVILDLEEGDQVYLRKPGWVSHHDEYDDLTTSFSGFLIHPEA